MNKWLFAVSTCALGALTASHVSHAQPQQSPGPVEQVLVSVPVHRTQAETALPITVLSGEELHKRLAKTLGETLGQMPGISNAGFGPGVGQPVIRGQQGARVKVLANSTGSADASTSSSDHAVAVEPLLAESIEVIRGPATLLYGGGAIGGIVNVIDNRIPVALPERTETAIELRHASASDENVGVVRMDSSIDRIAVHVDGVWRESNNLRIPGRAAEHDDDETTDGYIGNTDTEAQSVTAGGSLFLDSGFVGIAVNHMTNEYGIPSGAHEHEDDHGSGLHDDGEEESVRIDMEQTRIDVRGEYQSGHAVIENIHGFLTYSDYEHKELEGAETGTRWSNENWEARLELLHRPVAGWDGVLGIQLNAFELAAEGEESFIPRTEVTRLGMFLVEGYQWQQWLFELGARWDLDNLDPKGDIDEESFSNLSLSASGLWQFHSQWSLGIAMASSERAPVIEELYSNEGNDFGDYVEHVASGVIELGDTDLKREQANSVDITLSYVTDRTDAYVTIFYNDFQDFIYLDNTGEIQDDVDILAYRQADAEFTGVEFEIDMTVGQLAGGNINLRLFGDWIQGQLDDGQDLPRLPPLRIGSRLSYERNAFTGFLEVVDASDQDKPGANEESTDGYTRWDMGTELRYPSFAEGETLLFLKLKNVTDEEVRDSTSLLREVAPEAGRSLEVGLRVSF